MLFQIIRKVYSVLFVIIGKFGNHCMILWQRQDRNPHIVFIVTLSNTTHYLPRTCI